MSGFERDKKKKKYRVGWYCLDNPDKINYGNWSGDKNLVIAWVKEGNKKFSEINHFLNKGQ
jgi:hypothetical protein